MELPYQQYFESMPCYLTVQDRNLKVISANKWFVEDFGSYEGRYCYQVYKNRPEKCEVCPVERTFRDGQRHSSEEHVRCLDGSEVSVIVYTTPIYNKAGEITAVMEMSTDITEIKQLQKQNKESQEKYRLLFEEVPCFISIQDRDMRIVHANRLHREAFGPNYGAKCYEAYKHRTEECVPCIVRQTFQDGEMHVHEEVVSSIDGKMMNVLVYTSPLRNAEGEIEQVIEISTDITQIRELQDQLTSIGLLISTISHGIKGILNGLDGGIYLVNNGLKKNNPARVEQGWEIVLRNVTRVRSMVLDILYYAKDREPDWELLSGDSIANDVYTLTKDKADELGVELTKEINMDIGEFEADDKAIRSLLVNLMENSLDACRIDNKQEAHRVVLRAVGEVDHVRFEVQDDGIGMEQETREKAFSLFFSSKGTEGTGLGLFIAHKIAKAHKGSIDLESEVDKGTRFIVRIPRKHVQTMAVSN